MECGVTAQCESVASQCYANVGGQEQVVCTGAMSEWAGRRCPIAKWYVDVLIERRGVGVL